MFCCFKKNSKVSPMQFIDEPLNNEITEKLKQSQKVVFGDNFNYPLINLPNSINYIKFNGKYFNHSLDNLPNSLIELCLNDKFNQPLDYLPYGLKILKFRQGSIFSHTLDNLPNSIKILEIPILYNHEINCLPDSIEDLRIGVKTMINDDNIFYREYCNEDNIEYFNKPITKLPVNLKRLIIFPEYIHLEKLKKEYKNKIIVISRDTFLYYNMTLSNSLYLKPKSILINEFIPEIDLIIHGQGVFLFKNTNNNNQCIFNIYNKNMQDWLKFEFTKYSINVTKYPSKEPLIDEKNKQGLCDKLGAYYWVSIDYQNLRIYAGVGEPRMETVIYRYFMPKNNKKFLEGLIKIQIPQETVSLVPIKILRDPITFNIPLIVKNTNELTMNDVAQGAIMPKPNLTPICQKLYDCVSGEKFVLNDSDFPDFSRAIEYSIATPGCWCNQILINKSKEFSKDPNIKETYIRITLGQNNGESPGIPYVMEIWPVGHYSPVHNHGGANAIIRVLNGSINVSLFPFLCPDKNEIKPFAVKDFYEGDITWISSTLNQVHQLKNLETNVDTCITIQCYMYDEGDKRHYDYFDYLDEDDNKQQYDPDSDMDFVKFKQTMRDEWENRPWTNLFNQSCFMRKKIIC